MGQFQDERLAIEKRFSDNWSSTNANRIKYENAPFNQPESGSWVRLSIRPASGQMASIAETPLNRHVGIIILDVFVSEDTGQDTARSLADDAASIFRRAQFSAGSSGTVTCREPFINVVGVEDGWFMLSVTTPYQRDFVL